MKRMQKWIIFGVAVFLLTNGVYYAALADHDAHKEKRWHQKIFDRGRDEGGKAGWVISDLGEE